MNRIYICGFCFLLSSCGVNESQQEVNIKEIQIVQEFSEGESFTYELSKQNIDSRKPGIERYFTTTPVTISFFLNKKDSVEVVWLYGESGIKDIFMNEIYDPMYTDKNMYADLQIKYIANKKGEFLEFLNFQESSEKIKEKIYSVLESKMSEDTIGSGEKRLKLLNFFEPTFEDQNTFYSVYLTEFFPFVSLFGYNLHTDSVYVTESQLPNPFTNDLIPVTDSIYIKSINGETAEIVYSQTYDSDSIIYFIKNMANEVFQAEEEKIKGEFPTKIYVCNQAVYQYDYINKIMIEMYFEKRVELDQTLKINSWKMVLK